jgi:DNA-binding NtrC family response regulator
MPPLKDEQLRRLPIASKRVTLLAVGDDAATLDSAMRVAHSFGFDTASCSGAADALKEIRARRPDAVFVDLHRPGTAGIELLRTIREIDSSCAVILMRAPTDVDSTMQAVRLGALDCLARPLDADRLR